MTAAAVQMAPPVTHRQTAATPRAPLLKTATAAVTATTTAHPPLPPPPRPQTALTQAAPATRIRGLRRGRRRRNEQLFLHYLFHSWVGLSRMSLGL